MEEDEGADVVKSALKSAFVRLDKDMSSEALPLSGALNMEALEVALSGACGCVVHVNDLDVHVANMGDTRAVIGQLEGDKWVAKALTTDHNTSNPDEVERVQKEHPSDEKFVIRNNRLLSQLIPLRAFGDMRYKWNLKDLKTIVSILDTPYARNIIPPNYYTPPYLSCKPQVTYHRLTQKDKFLVMATDGLWEQIENDKVVRLVADYLEGKNTQDNYRVSRTSGLKLGSINKQLTKRKSGLDKKSEDSDVATHLIRHALGQEHHKVSEMLTLPNEVVRYYRDDITVTVVLFDSDYVAKKSVEDEYNY